jgi:hypothetical protein
VNESLKKNFIYIHGPSNTGKTTYSTKVLSRYFGSENIGTTVSDSSFKFQDIEDKLFIILEEFRYKRTLSGEFLKLLGGEKLLTSKKYSKEHINLENLKGLIVSNSLIEEEDVEVYQALRNRLYLINFINKVIINDRDINDILIKEEPNIIIYCNKLYFTLTTKKQNRLKNILLKNKYNKNTIINLTYKPKGSFSVFYKFSHVIGSIENKEFTGKFYDKFVFHTNSIYSRYNVTGKIYEKTDEVLVCTNTTKSG